MRSLFRLVTVFFAVILTYLFVLLVPFALIPIPGGGVVESLVAWGAAAAVGVWTWKKFADAPSALVSYVLAGGLLVGGIGFSAGFFGPMIFAPEANQGPLLGIFITGPAGFVVGLIGGFFYWLYKR